MADLTEENGIMHYDLYLDNGDRLLIPVEDVTAILEVKERQKLGKCSVIPFRREKRRA